MSGNRNIIARAFEIARSGEVENVSQLAQRLSKEGFSQVEQHLDSPTLRRQLLTEIRRDGPLGKP